MSVNCTPFTWSSANIDSLQPVLIISTLAIIIHGLFWIQFSFCSNLRQRNMMWLYVYLISDFFLLARFFILYGLRRASVCLYPTLSNVLCYFEASSKFYLDTVQSYLFFAFNICRYLQIVFNRNIYTEKPLGILFSHLAIYFLPVINVVVQFLTNVALIWRRRGQSCDIQYKYLAIQMFNLIVTFAIPMFLNILVLGLCIRRASSTRGVSSEQIIVLRQKRQRKLLIQTIAFYSVWLLLWSPDVLVFQFTNINSDVANITAVLSYVELALDPLLLAIIDIRILTSWKSLWRKITRKAQRQIGVAS